MKMRAGFVSVIVPCYNCEKKMGRFLDSLLNQTYRKLDLIFVNDGSTDRTGELIHSYKDRYLDRGFLFRYFYKKNGGLCSAINKGLKHVTGEYLIWPDPDDWLSEDSIEKRVSFLVQNPRCGSVSSNYSIFGSDDFDNPISIGVTNLKDAYKEYQFVLMLKYRTAFCAGTHMVRTSVLRKSNPGMQIYDKGRGQNIQMLLPVYYCSRRGFLDEPLYAYVVYEDSLSHGDDTLDKRLAHEDEYYRIVIETLKRIPMSAARRLRYNRIARFYYCYKSFHCAREYQDVKVMGRELLRAAPVACVDMIKFAKMAVLLLLYRAGITVQ